MPGGRGDGCTRQVISLCSESMKLALQYNYLKIETWGRKVRKLNMQSVGLPQQVISTSKNKCE